MRKDPGRLAAQETPCRLTIASDATQTLDHVAAATELAPRATVNRRIAPSARNRRTVLHSGEWPGSGLQLDPRRREPGEAPEP